MPTIHARIATDRSARYLRQFCTHAEAMASPRGHRVRMHGDGNPLAEGEVRLRLDWTDTLATAYFEPWGRCALRAESDALIVDIDAADNEALQRIRDIVTRDLSRFGHGKLTIDWQTTAGDDDTSIPPGGDCH